MPNNIQIKDGGNNTIFIHTIEDSTSVHFNQSIATDDQGNRATVVSAGQATNTAQHGALVVAVRDQVSVLGSVSIDNLVAVSINGPLPAGTNHLGKVSIAGAFDVSVGSVVIADNAPVSIHGGVLNAVSIGGGAALIGGVSVRGIADVSIQDNAPVSVRNTVNVSINTVNTGIPNADGQSLGGATQGHLNTRSANMVFNRNSSTWDRLTGTSVGIPVSINPQILTVHVCNVSPAVSIGGVVTVTPFTNTGAAIPTAAFFVGGSDGTNVRAIRVNTSGNPEVDAKQLGTWTVQPGNTANTTPWLVSVGGNVSLTDNAPVSVRGGLIGLNAGSNLIGAVSVRGNILGSVSISNIADVSLNDNAPVSVRGGLIGLNAGSNLIGAVSVRGTIIGAVSIANVADVSIQDNAPVSIRGGRLGSNTDKTVIGAVSIADTILGTIGIKAGSAIIGSVSLAGINPVSIAGVVTVGSFTNTSATAPTGAFYVAGKDSSGDLIGMNVDSTGAQKISGFMSTPSYLLTRSTDTVSYAANDLVANTTVAGTVTPLSWPVSRYNAGTSQNISIRRARIRCSKTTTHRGHNFRLHLWNKGSNSTNSNANVSVANGDNGAFSATKASYYVGAIDVSCDYLFSDGSAGIGSANKGTEINIVTSNTGQVSISGYLEVLTSLAPTNAETFLVTLEMFQD